jgi:NAD-dependent SIR2 family protein deacetylase
MTKTLKSLTIALVTVISLSAQADDVTKPAGCNLGKIVKINGKLVRVKPTECSNTNDDLGKLKDESKNAIGLPQPKHYCQADLGCSE